MPVAVATVGTEVVVTGVSLVGVSTLVTCCQQEYATE